MSKTLQMYGIKNCDTVKKAKKWLVENNIEFNFHDFKTESLNAAQIKNWLEKIGKDLLINKRGTTWRQLNDEQKSIESTDELITLITDNPALIKRPLIEQGKHYSVGFNAQQWQTQFID